MKLHFINLLLAIQRFFLSPSVLKEMKFDYEDLEGKMFYFSLHLLFSQLLLLMFMFAYVYFLLCFMFTLSHICIYIFSRLRFLTLTFPHVYVSSCLCFFLRLRF